MTSEFDKQLSQSNLFRQLQAQSHATDVILGRVVLLAAQSTPDPQGFLAEGLNACEADVELIFASNPDMSAEARDAILARVRELFAAVTTASLPAGMN
ncbi:MAG: hypothetical protein JJ866_10805 [Roseibium sp.]|uniref:hypothetical protein n=1 Tax=Roseibium sp. TaxID=1936156 RepID=UPI001B05EF34|nr:hypothetical protein [Roseibium sp.]MBO6892420.1 hypothetical protein [Roseibium sp.]MBO6928686.1 hypothetical protein [Roseibium sp.]